jgi:hypothetical protein
LLHERLSSECAERARPDSFGDANPLYAGIARPSILCFQAEVDLRIRDGHRADGDSKYRVGAVCEIG